MRLLVTETCLAESLLLAAEKMEPEMCDAIRGSKGPLEAKIEPLARTPTVGPKSKRDVLTVTSDRERGVTRWRGGHLG